MSAEDETVIEPDHVPRSMTCEHHASLQGDIQWIKAMLQGVENEMRKDRDNRDKQMAAILDLLERRRDMNGAQDVKLGVLESNMQQIKTHEERLSSLERWKAAVMGVAAIVSLVVSLLVRFAGSLFGSNT